MSIAAARRASSGERIRVRGVVTVSSGLIEPGSAAIQDASGGILIRLGADAGPLARGEMVELLGTRSTKAGMLSLRVVTPPIRLGRLAEPIPLRVATGRISEAQEALLVVVRGSVVGKARVTSAGNRYFEIDDGSGEVRVFVASRVGVRTADLAAGAWIEVIGVLGQETTGRQPSAGYRIWPRAAADLRVLARPIAKGAAALQGPFAGSKLENSAGADAAVGPNPALPVPRLARAVPTASARPGLAEAVDPAQRPGDVRPAAGAAALVLAGLALLAASGLGLTPDWLTRLRMASVEGHADDGPDHDPDSATRLIPLTVLDGQGSDAARAGPSTQNGGRILPPT
jgi:hypothetical protein